MGLDMYLSAEKYVSGYQFRREAAEHNESAKQEVELYDTIVAAIGHTPSPDSPSVTIEVTVAYWRKVNAVHQWFVENVQGGNDDCNDYEVSREQLEELLALCKQVVDNNAAGADEILPTQGGFFFGSTEYDEYYLEDIKDTVTQLESVLAEFAPKEGDTILTAWSFKYRSSW